MSDPLPTIDYASPKAPAQITWIRKLLALGIAVFLGTAILLPSIALLFPAFSSSKSHPLRVRCASHLREIGQGLMIYANDNQGRFPARLSELHSGYDLTPSVFVCPESNATPSAGPTTQQVIADLENPAHCSYIYLGAGMTAATSANMVVGYENPLNHPEGGLNVLYADGHVEFLTATEAQRVVGHLVAGRNPPPTLSK